MSPTQNRVLVVALAALGLALAGYRLHVLAEGTPTSQPLWYAGTVSDAKGAPLTGNHQVAVRLFQTATGSQSLCTSGPATLPFERGRFRIEMPPECVAVVRTNPDLFVEVSVDDDSKPFPRSKIGAVPYALEAQHAVTASGADGALKQALDQIPKISPWMPFKPAVFANQTQLALNDDQATGRYRRVGDTVEAIYSFKVEAVGASTGIVSFELPLGLKPDLDKLVSYAIVGSGLIYSSSASVTWVASSELNHLTSRVQLVVSVQQAGGAVLAHDFPFALNGGGAARFNVSVPVLDEP